MLFKTAISGLIYEKEKYLGAVIGVALAVFLVVLQWGFYAGFKRDITAIIDAFDSDLWIIPKHRPSFDIWDSMDDLAYWKAVRHPEVDKAARIIWSFAIWRAPSTGAKQMIQVLGVDYDSGITVDLGLRSDLLAPLLRGEDHVLICDRDRPSLGIDRLGQEGAEIFGHRAVVVGYTPKFIHLFTTAHLVVTDLTNARTLAQFPGSDISYVVVKCRPGAAIDKVVQELQAAIPEHQVQSTRDFHHMSGSYWEKKTGIGPVLLLSAFLGAFVGFLIVMLTFYISTIEKIPIFASLKALGASTLEIIIILAFQVMMVYVSGLALGGLGLYLADQAVATTTISLLITPTLILVAAGAMAGCSALGCILPVLKLIKTEPGEAFRT
jgi:putative ABC transport system permease protein